MKNKAKRPRQPLADKILKQMQKEINKEIVDLTSVRAGRKHASDLQSTIANTKDLAALPPAHAAYAWVQNQLSIMAEQLLNFSALHRFQAILEKSDDLYQPLGPPMSPLTPSYHACWSLFDISVGMGRETLGSIAVAVNQKFGAHASFLDLARKMIDSRCSVYQVVSSTGNLITLKDLFSGKSVKARYASGYGGVPGELWYTRVLPPNDLEPDVHVVFNTPYNMYQTSAQGWQHYFERVVAKSKPDKRDIDFHLHMKYGPEPFYWPEYIFYSYYNHTENYILSKGLPDIPESLPHNDKYQSSRNW